jgi:hypothetical protein
MLSEMRYVTSPHLLDAFKGMLKGSRWVQLGPYVVQAFMTHVHEFPDLV